MRRSLTPRLVLAFVAVAIVAVVVLATLILVSARNETAALAQRDQQATANAAVQELARARATAKSWLSTAFSPAAAVAARGDAVLTVRDQSGAVVFDSRPNRGAGRRGSGASGHGSASPVVVDGRTQGTAELRFRGGLTRSEEHLRTALGRTAIIGSLVAVLVAVLIALLVSRRVTAPLKRLIGAARGLEAGDRSARAAEAHAPGELGELAVAFDRMAESVEEQEQQRRHLAADLSHEVRTPVTVIRGNLEELIDAGEPVAPERLGPLNEEVLRLTTLLGQLDDLARADLPQRRLDCSEFRLDELAASTAAAVRPYFEANAIELRSRIERVTIRADRVRIGQVIENLLSNALKFTPTGGSVELVVERVEGEAVIQVQDTGPGIREEDVPHVFDRFWRGAEADGVGGRGLGLSIVAEIAHAHGGSADVVSRLREGSRFVVRLPLG